MIGGQCRDQGIRRERLLWLIACLWSVLSRPARMAIAPDAACRSDPGVVPLTIQQLRAAHRATPFRPFTLHMADGRSFHVPHPDFLSMSPSGRTVIIYEENDEFSILDLLLMSEIKMGSNSKKRPT